MWCNQKYWSHGSDNDCYGNALIKDAPLSAIFTANLEAVYVHMVVEVKITSNAPFKSLSTVKQEETGRLRRMLCVVVVVVVDLVEPCRSNLLQPETEHHLKRVETG